jgi:hypothetical protein
MRSHVLTGPRGGRRFVCDNCAKVFRCAEHELPCEPCPAPTGNVVELRPADSSRRGR